MPKLSYDLSAIPDSAFVALEHGQWRAKLVACTKGPSKAGKPMLTWRWQLMNGPNKGEETRTWTSLQENALFGLKGHLLALGYSETVDVDTDDLIGKRVLLVIGETTRKVDGVDTKQTGVKTLLPLPKVTDDEPAPAPKPKAKAPAADDDDDEPKAKAKAEAPEDDEPKAKPAKAALKTVPGKVAKAAADDDDDDEPF